MRFPSRRLAGITAAAAAAAALTVGVQTAAHASSYCTGNVIEHYDGPGFSTRLIKSYDGGSICVNTWNQSGKKAWLRAEEYIIGGPELGLDYGYYSQYASTGFKRISRGQCIGWTGDIGNTGYVSSRCF